MVVSPGKRGQQGAVCPAQLDALPRGFAGQQAIKEPAGKSIAAADPVENIQLTAGET